MLDLNQEIKGVDANAWQEGDDEIGPGKVVLVGVEKGGVGKTTLAVSLAALFANQGKEVVLVDCDPQRDASSWVALRDKFRKDRPVISTQQLKGDVELHLRRLRKKYDVIIVDVQGADCDELRTALFEADAVLAPIEPGAFDVARAKNLDDVVGRIRRGVNPKLKSYLVLNKTPREPNSVVMKKTIAAVEKFAHLKLVSTFTSLNDIRASGGQGLGVTEYAPESRAAQLMTELFQKISEGVA